LQDFTKYFKICVLSICDVKYKF